MNMSKLENKATKLRNKQKDEAIIRMKALDLFEDIVVQFEETGLLYKSEMHGVLYWLDNDNKKLVLDWEEETGNLAFHVVVNDTEFGELLSVFYVSKHEEEWAKDKEDIANDYAVVYVLNKENPMFSEFGGITFERSIGGLVRVG